jgi:dihydrofolate reductase
MLAIVLAMDVHGLIGKDNDLPWHYPEDLKYFKSLTLGHTVLMGRKTFQSIYKRLNKALPNRENVVLTRQDISYDGVQIIHDLSQFLNQNEEEDIYIIGGKEIFNQTIDLVDVLYVTHIKHIHEGDQYLQIDFSRFSSEIIKETEDLIFTKYTRRKK